jgi:hypothetical protein
VFDDEGYFSYLSEFETVGVVFHACRSFGEIGSYLTNVSLGKLPSPAFMALDVFCEIHPDFLLLGVDEQVEHNVCGFQLYEFILRPLFPDVPVLFFTSFASDVALLPIERLRRMGTNALTHCEKEEFKSKLLEITERVGILAHDDVLDLLQIGLAPDEYVALFGVLADEWGFSDREKLRFLGMSSHRAGDIKALLRLSTALNERIDELLAISVLLDSILDHEDKRRFVEVMPPIRPGRRNLDLVLSGCVRDLTFLRSEMEFRLGGGIL